MADGKEPQSYGSQGDWESGNVGEQVNRLKGKPNSQHADFYESRHDEESEVVGGDVSPSQLAERDHAPAPSGRLEEPAHKITAQPSGARRGGYFKDRDYE